MVYSQKQQLGVDTRQSWNCAKSAKEHKASALHDELDWESCHLGLLTFWSFRFCGSVSLSVYPEEKWQAKQEGGQSLGT